ncbi:hypothetical protein QJS04_geneDACA003316 [Acorus gramineus]|uniref:Protein SAR DEFICIENT 4 n=1 Tax=Acorus gramineus TaxID=55184 RepID=A0AAV9BQ29_ACOGR|nr:hypothetical protein QJS04_geneDACA003316 [Acorus gramineus]
MSSTANHPPSLPQVLNLDASAVRSTLSYPTLISHLRSSLPSVSLSLHSPLRHNHTIDEPTSSSLLLMPSWSTSPSLPYIGVKILTSFPQNSSSNLPGINASYVLFDSSNGQTLASMEGTELTLWRTSSQSALASTYLSRTDSEVLVMVGAGALAYHLVRAHLHVRPSLKRVFVWNRTVAKAEALVRRLGEEGVGEVVFEVAEGLEEVIGLGDIISCATGSDRPLVFGERMKRGAHLDLVGSFGASMRECDDKALRRGRVFVDCEAALEESGELLGAFERGVLERGDVEGRLVELVSGEKVGRRGDEEVTVFKSVGSAVLDILAAQLVYEDFLQR